MVYPYGLGLLKTDFPNISFSEHPDPKLLGQLGIYPVEGEAPPGMPGKIFSELEPGYRDGKYFRRWQESEEDPARLDMLKKNRWEEVRQTRNGLLRESDFTMLEDYPKRGILLKVWKKYRQELRDVTLQEDPFGIVWPVKPE